MTTYLLALLTTVASLIFFSSETEQSRIVTIQRPLVITQERKTPAFFVYQQIQKLQEKKRELAAVSKNISSTYLSTLSLSVPKPKVLVAEMKFNKSEFLYAPDTGFRTARFSENRSTKIDTNYEIKNQTYERAFASKSSEKYLTHPAAQSPPTLGLGKKWATIRGKFELVDGVGITDHYIELKRIEEGRVREIGRIDLKAGLYSIDIESPRGYLSAEIKDRNGQLIGEDRERLINLLSRGSFYEGPFLRVGHPAGVATNPVFASSVNAAGVTGKNANGKVAVVNEKESSVSVSIFDTQNIFEKPGDIFTNISQYSSTISRTFDPSRIYKNMTTIRHAGEKTETIMFTSKWLEGVVSYISDSQKIEFKSKNGPIIIGRVLINGKPVLNAEVQITTAPGVAPVYLDQFMIPSFTQTATSENGYFMFIGLEPDNYQIVAHRQGVAHGSQMFIAEEDSIAFQNISGLSIPRTKIIRSFDAFTAEPKTADIVFAESEEAQEVTDGTTTIKTFSEFGICEYLVRTSDRQYMPIRYVQSSGQEYAHLPMIQEAWLENIKSFKKISNNSTSGVIIGFTQDLDFDVYITLANYNKNDVVYFNASGNVVSEPTTGGGFILFNVPVGAREVIVQERNADRIYSQVFNVLDQQVSVAHFAAD